MVGLSHRYDYLIAHLGLTAVLPGTWPGLMLQVVLRVTSYGLKKPKNNL